MLRPVATTVAGKDDLIQQANTNHNSNEWQGIQTETRHTGRGSGDHGRGGKRDRRQRGGHDDRSRPHTRRAPLVPRYIRSKRRFTNQTHRQSTRQHETTGQRTPPAVIVTTGGAQRNGRTDPGRAGPKPCLVVVARDGRRPPRALCPVQLSRHRPYSISANPQQGSTPLKKHNPRARYFGAEPP